MKNELWNDPRKAMTASHTAENSRALIVGDLNVEMGIAGIPKERQEAEIVQVVVMAEKGAN